MGGGECAKPLSEGTWGQEAGTKPHPGLGSVPTWMEGRFHISTCKGLYTHSCPERLQHFVGWCL